MRGLFDPAGRKSILEKIGRLEPVAARLRGNTNTSTINRARSA
jgi:hypothetical protein